MANYLRFTSAFLFALALAGCSFLSGKVAEPTTKERGMVSLIPEYGKYGVNSEIVAELGGSIISSGKVAYIPSIILEEPFEVNAVHRNFDLKLKFPPGSYVLEGGDGSGQFYKLEGTNVEFIETVDNTKRYYSGGFYIPNNENGQPEAYWKESRGYGVVDIYTNLTPSLKFRKSKYERWAPDELRRELVYSGVSGNTVSILYRELTLDPNRLTYMARPAFSQEIKYDLSQSDIIGYRGARFQVIKATNTNIRVKLLQYMNE